MSAVGQLLMSYGALTFSDDFNDNARDTAKWDATTPGAPFTFDSNVTAAETSSQLQITPRSSFASASYNGYTSHSSYDLTDKYVSIEVPQAVAGPASGTDQRFVVYLDSNNYAHFAILGNGSIQQVTLRARTAGSNSETNVTYNSTSHRWWRFRHQTSGGHLFFDTSSDGASWTNLRDYTGSLFAVTSLKVGIVAGTFSSIASPGTAIFDNFVSNLS